MTFAINTHDAWGVELVQTGAAAGAQRLAWFAFA
jgi:hypothetical protein